MNKKIRISMYAAIILLFSIWAYVLDREMRHIETILKNDVVLPPAPIASVKDSTEEWDRLVRAIIKVESEGNIRAVNKKSGAAGILQIMPVLVKDANRIVGNDKYRLSDRFDPDTSIEIFNVIQDHYNPSHDIEKAIRLHNPRAGEEYRMKIIKNLNTKI